MNHIRHAIAAYKALGPKTVRPSTPSQRDPIHEITDHAEWVAAMKARQNANKHATYARHRQDRYASASYSTLRAEQDPRGKISRWLESGPRALLLAGPSRTGKTTAAYSIANDADHTGQWVVARTAADLSAALKPDGDPLAYQYAVDCDLLYIDDLGRERVTDWWLEQLQRIVDDRCGNKKRLIVTANTPTRDPAHPKKSAAELAFDYLAERYTTPIAERLIDGGGVIIFDGPAVREVVTEW
ncbi:MAG: ATP-binding protein [Actinomycetota bacterium]|nr:ATP-binding protein [Actinomycetota bacterium]